MFIIYLLFGCLIKIGSIFHIIKVLGGSENQKIGAGRMPGSRKNADRMETVSLNLVWKAISLFL